MRILPAPRKLDKPNVAIDDHSRRATEHRPQDIGELRAAILRMRADHLGDNSIAAATGLSVEAVRRLVGCTECE